ncbi:unnamed protein product [marine sediment metagenome]|uniref:Uncharacterized protein n=1 Tax=marine sediment metagenome TaxID=412755 RepID=X1FA20_9ZZZZ
MKTKLIVGSILVLTILLLTPSIPAIQQKSIEDKAYSDLVEELKVADLKEIEELEKIRHPVLYLIFFLIANINYNRVLRLVEFVKLIGVDNMIGFIIFWYSFWIFLKGSVWLVFWLSVSDLFGWGWDISHINLNGNIS